MNSSSSAIEGKNALDRDETSVRAILGAKHLRHTADVDALGELVGAKRLGAIQRRSDGGQRARLACSQMFDVVKQRSSFSAERETASTIGRYA